MWLRAVAALGAPGVCPCATTPAGDTAWLSSVSPSVVALLQLQGHRSCIWDEQIRSCVKGGKGVVLNNSIYWESFVLFSP